MSTDLRNLITHKSTLAASMLVGDAFHHFNKHPFEFMAVLDGIELIGLCARSDIATLLGSQYGYALFSHKPLQAHLRSDAVIISIEDELASVFERVFNRDENCFFDDVLLTDAKGIFLGLISTRTLVKLQNRVHLSNIEILQQQQTLILEKNVQMEQDLRMSRELQQALLIARHPSLQVPRKAGTSLQFHHLYHPVEAVGGDFFHVKQVSETTVGIFIADVMGHGVRAALVTAMLRALLEESENEASDPARLLAYINVELTRILTRAESSALFVTGLYMLVDTRNCTAQFATAGHPQPLHIQRRNKCVRSLEQFDAGTVLGVFESSTYTVTEFTLKPDDIVLLYTDGLVEIEGINGEEYGVNRLLEESLKSINLPLRALMERQIHLASASSSTGKFKDDVCLLGIELREAP